VNKKNAQRLAVNFSNGKNMISNYLKKAKLELKKQPI